MKDEIKDYLKDRGVNPKFINDIVDDIFNPSDEFLIGRRLLSEDEINNIKSIIRQHKLKHLL